MPGGRRRVSRLLRPAGSEIVTDPTEAPFWVQKLPRAGVPVAAYRKAFRSTRSAEGDNPPVIVRILDPRGELLRDTVMVLPGEELLVSRSGGVVNVASHPFARRPVLRVGEPDELFAAYTDSSGITVSDRYGVPRATLRFTAHVQPVTREQRDRAMASCAWTASEHRGAHHGCVAPALRRRASDRLRGGPAAPVRAGRTKQAGPAAAKKIEALPPRPRRSSGGCERRAVATRALLSGLVSPRATRRLRGTRRDVLGQSFRARRPTAPSKVRPEVLRVAG